MLIEKTLSTNLITELNLHIFLLNKSDSATGDVF